MNHHYSNGTGKFVVGMTMGIITGAAVGMTMAPSRREMKRMAHKATQRVSAAVEDLADSMGM